MMTQSTATLSWNGFTLILNQNDTMPLPGYQWTATSKKYFNLSPLLRLSVTLFPQHDCSAFIFSKPILLCLYNVMQLTVFQSNVMSTLLTQSIATYRGVSKLIIQCLAVTLRFWCVTIPPRVVGGSQNTAATQRCWLHNQTVKAVTQQNDGHS